MNHSSNPHVEALPERQPYCPGCTNVIDDMDETETDRKGKTWHAACLADERHRNLPDIPVLQPIRMTEPTEAIARIKAEFAR